MDIWTITHRRAITKILFQLYIHFVNVILRVIILHFAEDPLEHPQGPLTPETFNLTKALSSFGLNQHNSFPPVWWEGAFLRRLKLILFFHFFNRYSSNSPEWFPNSRRLSGRRSPAWTHWGLFSLAGSATGQTSIWWNNISTRVIIRVLVLVLE